MWAANNTNNVQHGVSTWWHCLQRIIFVCAPSTKTAWVPRNSCNLIKKSTSLTDKKTWSRSFPCFLSRHAFSANINQQYTDGWTGLSVKRGQILYRHSQEPSFYKIFFTSPQNLHPSETITFCNRNSRDSRFLAAGGEYLRHFTSWCSLSTRLGHFVGNLCSKTLTSHPSSISASALLGHKHEKSVIRGAGLELFTMWFSDSPVRGWHHCDNDV